MTSNGDQSPPAGREDIGTAPASEGSAAEVPRARLTRLKINRFRQVRPGTELRFDGGINVLLGRNGTGKTTLLELVCALARGDLRAYQHESFDLEFDIHLRDCAIVASARNSSPEPTADPFSRKNPHTWEMRTRLIGPDDQKATIDATHQVAKMSLGDGPSKDIPADDASPFQVLFHVFPFFQHWPGETLFFGPAMTVALLLGKSCLRLDEGLDTFRCITSGESLPNLDSPLSITSQSIGSPAQPSFCYAPVDLVAHIYSQGPSLHQATSIGIDQSNFKVLDAFIQAIDAKSISCSMVLLKRVESPETRATTSSFGKPSFWITTHRGTTFTHDQLSYGEKRLLTFMYHAAANPHILVADELVNGLHHEWIQACLDAIQGQAFLTSQNPLLLDHLPFHSAEEVERRFILCDRDEHGDWIWRNMDEDAAGAFYRAYEVGVQHVSGILRTKGLW